MKKDLLSSDKTEKNQTLISKSFFDPSQKENLVELSVKI